MAKQKIIDFKPAKEKKGQQGSTITKIHWENEEVKNFFPTIKQMREKEVEEKAEDFGKYKLQLSKTLHIEYVYKLTEELEKALVKKKVNYMPANSDEEEELKQQNKEVFYTDKELTELIQKYLNSIMVKEGKEEKPGK